MTSYPSHPDTYEEKFKHVLSLSEGIQLVAAAEATALGIDVGLDPQMLYTIICGAAGYSRMFETRVPRMLTENAKQPAEQLTDVHTLQETINRVDDTLKVARSLKVKFGAPLLSSAFSYLTAAGANKENLSKDDSVVFKLWGQDPSSFPKAESVNRSSIPTVASEKVGFVGLGSMGLGMAKVLLNAKVNVMGYDSFEPCRKNFEQAGGKATASATEVAKDSKCLIFMTVSLEQAESVLFDDGAINNLPHGACVMFTLTAPPSGIVALRKRIDSIRPDIEVVDAPVSGGAARAANGTLTMMVSSAPGNTTPNEKRTGLEIALPLLEKLSGSDGKVDERLYLYPNKLGQGNSVKMINQLLAGVHVAASAETIAFARALGLEDLVKVQNDLVKHGAGFMMNNRMFRFVRKDRTIESKMDILVKDLSIVCNEASRNNTSVPTASLALTKFLDACVKGWDKDDDSTVIRLWHHLPLDLDSLYKI